MIAHIPTALQTATETADDGVRIRTTDSVTELVITRDAKRNSLSAAVVERLITALAQAEERGSRLVVLRGEGRCFSAGFDLSDLADSTDGDLFLRFVRIQHLLHNIESAPMPTLALVHGRTFGAGADIALACTHRVLDPGAQLRMPGLRFDLVLGTGRLKRLVGKDNAHRILQTSATVSARDALDLGLATALSDQESWPEHVKTIAEQSSALSSTATAALLRVLDSSEPDPDLAALVHSASAPGLADRIRRYQQESR